jgi:hypothetical protein
MAAHATTVGFGAAVFQAPRPIATPNVRPTWLDRLTSSARGTSPSGLRPESPISVFRLIPLQPLVHREQNRSPADGSGATEARWERAFHLRREAGRERGFGLASLGEPFQVRPMPLVGRCDAGRWLDKAEEAKHGCDVMSA